LSKWPKSQSWYHCLAKNLLYAGPYHGVVTLERCTADKNRKQYAWSYDRWHWGQLLPCDFDGRFRDELHTATPCRMTVPSIEYVAVRQSRGISFCRSSRIKMRRGATVVVWATDASFLTLSMGHYFKKKRKTIEIRRKDTQNVRNAPCIVA